jgi:hypothetical protein
MGIHRNSHQPRANIRTGLEGGELPACTQERLLNEILGLMSIAGEAVQQSEDGIPMLADPRSYTCSGVFIKRNVRRRRVGMQSGFLQKVQRINGEFVGLFFTLNLAVLLALHLRRGGE